MTPRVRKTGEQDQCIRNNQIDKQQGRVEKLGQNMDAPMATMAMDLRTLLLLKENYSCLDSTYE